MWLEHINITMRETLTKCTYTKWNTATKLQVGIIKTVHLSKEIDQEQNQLYHLRKKKKQLTGLELINKSQWQQTDGMIIFLDILVSTHLVSMFLPSRQDFDEWIPPRWIIEQHCCHIRVILLLSCALYHGVLLTGILQAGRRPGYGPTVWTRHCGLDVPLQEVKEWVPPGVGEVVIGWALQGLKRRPKKSSH